MAQSFKNFKTEDVNAAYKEVLGRDANEGELKGFTTNNVWFRDIEDLKRGVASTREAQKKGVDITKYGDSYVDNTSGLDEKQASIYAVLKEGSKGRRILKSELDAWAGKSLNQLKADRAAKSVTLTNGVAKVYDTKSLGFLTNEGGEVDDVNFQAGDTFLVPKGTLLKGRLKIAGEGSTLGDEYAGYDIVSKEARKKSGLVGGAVKSLGGSKGMANSFDRAAGQLATVSVGPFMSDEASAIAGGTRGAEARGKMFKSVGIKTKTLQQVDTYGDIGTAIAASVVDSVFLKAPVTSSVVQIANQAEAASLGHVSDKSWTKLATNLAVDWAAHGITKGLSAYGEAKQVAAVANATDKSVKAAELAGKLNTAWRFGSPAATPLAKGGTVKDAVQSAAVSAAVGAIPAKTALGGTFRALTAGSLSYALADKNMDSKSRLINASAAAAGSLASTAAQRYATGSGPAGSWSETKADLGIGPEGKAAWEASFLRSPEYAAREAEYRANATTALEIRNPAYEASFEPGAYLNGDQYLAHDPGTIDMRDFRQIPLAWSSRHEPPPVATKIVVPVATPTRR